MTTQSPALISIIVPCYNQEKYIIECLDSIRSQTYFNWECIVIDDGSADNTGNLVQNYIVNETRIKYYRQQNSGVSAARNNAIALSKGKYILPLDGDDKIGPSYLEKAVVLMENDEQLSVVYCEAEYFENRSGKWILPDYSFELLLQKNLFFCTALFKRSDFDKIGGYDTHLKVGLEDWEFWISLLSLGGKIYQIKETLFYYRILDNSRNISFNEAQRKDIKKYVYSKHKQLYYKYFDINDLLQQNNSLEFKNKELRNSIDYKIGRMVLMPFRFFKKIVS